MACSVPFRAPWMNQTGLRVPLATMAFSMLIIGVSPTPALTRATGDGSVGSRENLPRGARTRSLVPGATASWK